MSRKKTVKRIFSGVGERIKGIRGGLSQKEFGRIIDISQGQVNRYETEINFPGDDTLKKIADYGGVTVIWLLHGEEKMEIREELAPFDLPVPGAPELKEPFVYAAVDTTVLAQIMIEAEKSLKKRKRELSFVRKAHLYSLLYDHFQKTGEIPDRAKIEEFLRLAG